MADTQISPVGTVTAPSDWVVPNALEITLGALFAHFNGSGAAGDFVPTAQIISDSGATVVEIPMDGTVVAGSSVEATWAPFLRGAIVAPLRVGARVYNSVAISTANATSTPLTFDSERYDTGDFHSTTSNTGRLVARTAGQYIIGGHLRFDVTFGAVGKRQVSVRINGGLYIAVQDAPAIATDSPYMSIATAWTMAAGDYAELICFQNSGGNLDARGANVEGDSSLEFWIEKQ